MAILQTCCCWQSVRKGSFACAYYSLAYHIVSLVVMTPFLLQERQYLQGNASSPAGKSIIEKGTISHVSMAVSVVMVCLSCVGVITTFLLLYGLNKNYPYLLLPWVISMTLTITMDASHSVYLFVQETMKWNPLTAMIYTIDFFSTALNCYAMVCVYSQYQELHAGRGRADQENRILRLPAVQFNARPTATSCLSTRHEATYHVTRATPSSPSHAGPEGCCSPGCAATGCGHGRNGSTKAVAAGRGRHVKFPDLEGPTARQRHEHGSHHLDAGDVQVAVPEESKMLPAVDTAPLLEKKWPRSPPGSQ